MPMGFEDSEQLYSFSDCDSTVVHRHRHTLVVLKYRCSIRGRSRSFLVAVTSRSTLGLIQSPMEWVLDDFRWVKWRELEAGHSGLSAKIQNAHPYLHIFYTSHWFYIRFQSSKKKFESHFQRVPLITLSLNFFKVQCWIVFSLDKWNVIYYHFYILLLAVERYLSAVQ
jgi:hypothetical protein